ncbi:TAXI family TRAP transporter solute-binding subunit [Tepidibacillus infernus]|uniref:C4-dicarboxylate ABC transporter substrate-binding protein n=1 Tax=Tepidibacillus decaturensis TaxID=1413211 RepID=A0A135L3Y9_9BACI|nr:MULTISPECIES: TAXI family TRAP transporter solute-binding subunit [Tepidibacillus]KXG43599.1 C4-dicarboxylate ABC transporter substrate-binding protein [Tepidibacillus decaturensis]GBF12166.1 alkanesulfonate transporter substrate-binding subunit [Tepidibacillus sp. HK-1]
MKKFAFLLAITMLLSIALVGCGDQGGSNQLIIATGGTSGTYYPLGGGIAQIIKDNTDMDATAQTTGASAENMRLIASEEVDLAFTQTDIADYAVKGTEMFDKPVENLQAIASLYNETVQIVLPADSDIKSVADLKGRRVSVGDAGSGVEANAKQILEIYGLTFDDLQAERLSFGDSSQKIQDGQLDAAFITAGAPTSAVSELSATKGVKILNLNDDKIQGLIAKYPYYTEEVIPAGTYSGQNEDVKTVAVKAMLVARSGLSEDQVYNITKALFENLGGLVAINKKAEQISLETATQGISLPLHPGAAKYFEEKGIK